MKFILTIILLQSLISASLVDTYRKYGIKAVQKQLDLNLTSKTYWKNYLKSKDTKYGYYESITSVLICNKKDKLLTIYKKDNDKLKKQVSFPILLGKKKGDKQKEGDLKTPTGVYKLVKKLTKLDPFYGPLALVTSYPNFYDKIYKKSGSGIWIHGVPKDKKRANFTKGCIALQNDKLSKLDSTINYKKSILILQNNNLPKVTKKQISTILAQIYQWKAAWQKGDINKYLKFYDKNFKQAHNIDLKYFSKRKRRIFKQTKKKTILLSNINIIPYPNNHIKNMFRIIMYEQYKAKHYKFNGPKNLYIQLKSNGKISILTEH